ALLDIEGEAYFYGETITISGGGGSEGGQIVLNFVGITTQGETVNSWNLDVGISDEFKIHNSSNGAVLSIDKTTQDISIAKALTMDLGFRPMIVKQEDLMTSGPFNGFGRWGMIYDENTTDHPELIMALPGSDFADDSWFTVYGYQIDGTEESLFWVHGQTGDTGIAGNLDIENDLTVATGDIKISAFTVAGFVKNDTSGILSGGNTISVTDIPDRYWDRNIGNGYVYLKTATDDVVLDNSLAIGVSIPIANTQFYVQKDFEVVTGNGTNYKTIGHIYNRICPISVGVTDSGNRINFHVDAQLSDPTFLGTLDFQFASAITYGHVSGCGSGTIDDLFGLYMYYYETGSAIVNHPYGIYQFGKVTNYFDGTFHVGPVPTSNDYKMTVDFDDIPAVTSSTSMNKTAFQVDLVISSIASGETDSGERVGLKINQAINDTNFLGTLDNQFGFQVFYGSNTNSGNGTLNYATGIELNYSNLGSASVGESWGIKQNSAEYNYFEGKVRVGGSGTPAYPFEIDGLEELIQFTNVDYLGGANLSSPSGWIKLRINQDDINDSFLVVFSSIS
ncbi:MAG: hypothetical protein V3W20_12690, partial [Candidatus Neomarinimicrobiota bacterium]